MDAGEFDTPIIFLTQVLGTNQVNEPITTYVKAFATLAKIAQQSARETYTGDHVVDQCSIVFTIRYRPGIDDTMRIHYEGKEFRISPPKRVERRMYLEILGKAVDSRS